jgi:hypothetical protein
LTEVRDPVQEAVRDPLGHFSFRIPDAKIESLAMEIRKEVAAFHAELMEDESC